MKPADSASAAITDTFGSPDSAEQQRAEARQVCLTSTYAFATLVCGFDKLDPVLHGTMARWIERATYRKLGLAPRSHYKSTIWTVADKLRRATADPDIRILLVNEIIGNTVKWIHTMQQIVLSPEYQWLFPDVLPDVSDRRVRWNQTQLELRRQANWPEPTIEGVGVGGASTSNHYNIVHEDDLIGKAARDSPTEMEHAIDQHKLAVSLLISPRDAVSTVGTRWHVNDLVDWMVRHESDRLDYFHLGIDDELNPLFDGVPQDELRDILTRYGPAFFALQYKNRALASGATEFDPRKLRWYTTDTVRREGVDELVLRLERPDGVRTVLLRDCTVFQVTDAGLNPESDDARSAFVTVAITPKPSEFAPFEIVLLDQWARRLSPEVTVGTAHDAYMRWNPNVAAIEVFAGHEVFWHWLIAAYPKMRLRKLPKDTTRSKLTRIREWYPFVEQGRFYASRAHSDFIAEYEGFPTGRTVDVLDAIAWTPTVWFEPERLSREEAWERRREVAHGDDDSDAAAARAEGTRSPHTGY